MRLCFTLVLNDVFQIIQTLQQQQKLNLSVVSSKVIEIASWREVGELRR